MLDMFQNNPRLSALQLGGSGVRAVSRAEWRWECECESTVQLATAETTARGRLLKRGAEMPLYQFLMRWIFMHIALKYTVRLCQMSAHLKQHYRYSSIKTDHFNSTYCITIPGMRVVLSQRVLP